MSAKTELKVNLKGVDQVSGMVKGMVGKVAGLLAGAFAFHKLSEGAKEVFATLKNIEDSSMRAGMGAESYQKFSTAFKIMGIEADGVNKIILGMKKTVGNDAQSKMFAGLGLDIERLQGLDPESMFLTIGEAISKIPNEAERTKAAMSAFGKSAADLAPLFRAGPEEFMAGFRAMSEGLPIFSADAVSAADNIGDGFEAVGQILKVDLVNAFMDVANASGITFNTMGEGIIKAYYKIKLFIENTVDMFRWMKDLIVADFKATWFNIGQGWDDVAPLADVFQANIEKNMAESASAVEKFKLAMDFKDKLKKPPPIIPALDTIKIKLAEVKQAMSQFGSMALSGSIAAQQAQFGGLMPALGKGPLGVRRMDDPFSGAKGQSLLEQLYLQAKKQTTAAEDTAAALSDLETI